MNFQFSQTGGCTTKVNNGDEVLWVFDAFSKTHVLKLAGPASATTGTPVTVQVTDGRDGSPGYRRDRQRQPRPAADGMATLSFADAGVYRLKADRADSVRSNAITLCVDPPGADPCTSSDKAAPSVAPSLPGRRLASERGRSRTVLISWQARRRRRGRRVLLRGRRARGARRRQGQSPPATGSRSSERTVLTGVHFRGDSGSAYQFRITAVDRAANRTTIVDRPAGAAGRRPRPRPVAPLAAAGSAPRSSSAWGRTVVRAERGRRDRARCASPAAPCRLIGRKLAKGGRLRVTLDGKQRTLRLRGQLRPAQRALDQPARCATARTCCVCARLGGGPVELDAVAPRP